MTSTPLTGCNIIIHLNEDFFYTQDVKCRAQVPLHFNVIPTHTVLPPEGMMVGKTMVIMIRILYSASDFSSFYIIAFSAAFCTKISLSFSHVPGKSLSFFNHDIPSFPHLHHMWLRLSANQAANYLYSILRLETQNSTVVQSQFKVLLPH